MSKNIVMSSKVTEPARGLTHRELWRWWRELDIPEGEFNEQPARELLNLHDQNKSGSGPLAKFPDLSPFSDIKPKD